MRHLAFLHSLDELQADSAEWAENARAYALLLLIERWSAGEKQDAIVAGLRHASALDAGFDYVVASKPLDSITKILADGRATRRRRRRVAAGLMRYTLHLTYRGLTSLADDVADATMRCCNTHFPEIRWRACRLRGHFNRTMGNLEAAAMHFRRCVAVGRRHDVFEAVARGRTGIVHVLWSRGNLPAAERHARRLLALTQSNGRRDLVSAACHDLGAVMCAMKRYDEGVGYLRGALELSSGRQRDRIVNDIAFALSNRGSSEAARRLLETLVAIGSEPVAVTCARINLLQVYADLGDRPKLEAQRKELEAMSLSARERMYFHLTLGEALITLGDDECAIPEVQRASELASQGGFGQAVIDADSAMTRIAHATRPARPPSTPPNEVESNLIDAVSRVYANSRHEANSSIEADANR